MKSQETSATLSNGQVYLAPCEKHGNVILRLPATVPSGPIMSVPATPASRKGTVPCALVWSTHATEAFASLKVFRRLRVVSEPAVASTNSTDGLQETERSSPEISIVPDAFMN